MVGGGASADNNMLGGRSQLSQQASGERSRPRSRLLAMKERLRIQRQQQCQQKSGGNSQPDDVEQPSSTTSVSFPSADHAQAQTPLTGQFPIKGRRFQRSRHAEQQARSRSQDAITSSANNDGLLGCASAPRPLQKSKSVDVDLEKIVPPAAAGRAKRRSNTLEVPVEKLAASGSGGRKVEKKGSFLFRSSSLLARLSGRSGQKKLQSPSPLRQNGPNTVTSAESPDDSVAAAGANHSGTSSTLSKSVSLSEAGHLDMLTSSDSGQVEAADCRRAVQTAAASNTLLQPASVEVQGVSDHTRQADKAGFSEPLLAEERRTCHCSAAADKSGLPLSRADSRHYDKTAADLQHGSEILLAAASRRDLPNERSDGHRVASDNLVEGCTRRPHTSKKLTAVGRRVSISAGNLLNGIAQVKAADLTGSGVSVSETSASRLPVAEAAASSSDAVAMTTTSAHLQHRESSSSVYCIQCSQLPLLL